MSEMSLYLGGAKSGKSNAAINYAKNFSNNVTFIATCSPHDESMHRRIVKHRLERPSLWKTIENNLNLTDAICQIDKNTDLIIIDSIGIYTSNLLLANNSEESIMNDIESVVKTVQKQKYKTIFVSDEVGLGVHPSSSLGNNFRDILGNVNQIISLSSTEVFFFVAGLSIKIK